MISEVFGHALPVGAVFTNVTCSTDSNGALNCSGASAGLFAGLGLLLFVYLAIAVLGIVAAVKIVTKAGYSGWWVLIAFVPLLGSILVLIFAFSNWPVTREVEMLKRQLTATGRYGPPAGYGSAGGHGPYPAPGGPGPGPFPPDAPPGYEPRGPAPVGSLPAGSTVPGPGSQTDSVPLPTFGQYIRESTSAQAVRDDPASSSVLPSGLPDAGWFPAPGGQPGQERYWNGAIWTDQYR